MRAGIFILICFILSTLDSYGYESGGIRYNYEKSGGGSFMLNPGLIADSVIAPAANMEIIERVLKGYTPQNAPDFA